VTNKSNKKKHKIYNKKKVNISKSKMSFAEFQMLHLKCKLFSRTFKKIKLLKMSRAWKDIEIIYKLKAFNFAEISFNESFQNSINSNKFIKEDSQQRYQKSRKLKK
jgi:hypothetical protein